MKPIELVEPDDREHGFKVIWRNGEYVWADVKRDTIYFSEYIENLPPTKGNKMKPLGLLLLLALIFTGCRSLDATLYSARHITDAVATDLTEASQSVQMYRKLQRSGALDAMVE